MHAYVLIPRRLISMATAHSLPRLRGALPSSSPLLFARYRPHPRPNGTAQSRLFNVSARRCERQQDRHRKESFSSRLRAALGRTKVQWYPIPVGLGIGFLGLLQFTKIQRRERERLEAERQAAEDDDAEEQSTGRPRKRHRPRPSGPW